MKHTDITTRHEAWAFAISPYTGTPMLTHDSVLIQESFSYKSMNIRDIAACTVLHRYRRDNTGT